MANIKSAIKQIVTSEKARLRNRVQLSGSRSAVKDARLSIVEGDYAEAETATKAALSALDRAAQKGVIHPNKAARRKSRLMKSLNAIKPQK